jgi:beta-lactamase regulating signal transducer with metallopeptidase domain
MMSATNLHVLAQTSAERLLNSLAVGIVIALLAWLLLRLIGKRGSGTRFVVWFCALLTIAVSPFVHVGSAVSSQFVHRSVLTIPSAWASYLFAAWAGIACFGLLRVAAGLWHLRRLRRSFTTLELPELDPAVRQILAQFRSSRPVELCSSDELSVPTAIGFANPAVVVPAWALRELSADELNTAVLHELAHLQRWDDWTNLAQKVLRALFFFHPAVWWLESRLALDREIACDDMVLAQTANPRAYAACLVSLAEKNLLRRGIALAQAAVGRMRQTSLRILRILDARASHAVPVWRPAPWLVGVFSVACLISAAHAPKLVSFGNTSAEIVAKADAPAAVTALQSAIVPSPRVIPASYKEPSAGTSMAHTKRPARAPAIRQRKPARAQTAPLVIRTSAPATTPVPTVQQTVFVVMESQQFGYAGPMMWRVCVWRLTTGPQGTTRVVQEIVAKSI